MIKNGDEYNVCFLKQLDPLDGWIVRLFNIPGLLKQTVRNKDKKLIMLS